MQKLLLSTLLACSCLGVDSQWLDTLAQVESSGNPKAVGDGGKARGLYQMHAGTWMDVNTIREAKQQRLYGFESAFDPKVATEYAQCWADALESRLERSLGRPATKAEVWCAWNLGFPRFRQLGFDISRTPTSTQINARKFSTTDAE